MPQLYKWPLGPRPSARASYFFTKIKPPHYFPPNSRFHNWWAPKIVTFLDDISLFNITFHHDLIHLPLKRLSFTLIDQLKTIKVKDI